MKKKEFWDYNRKRKAPGSTPGSRLVQAMVAAAALTAAATMAASLFFYYFPAQAAKAVLALETSLHSMTQQIENSRQKKEPSLLLATLPTEEPQADDLTSEAGQTHSSGSMLVPSTQQGDVSQIGEQDNLDALDTNYLVMLNSTMGPILYFNQGDSRWGDYLYGGMDPMRKYGCGPAAVAMLVNAFSPYEVTPVEMADWCAANGCYAPQSGSYHSIIPTTLSAYGLKVESAPDRSYATAANLLRSGHILVALMGKGAFTSGGHFILITDILENGNVYIADPNSYDNTTKEWDLNQILAELKHASDSGGPLWVVGFP